MGCKPNHIQSQGSMRISAIRGKKTIVALSSIAFVRGSSPITVIGASTTDAINPTIYSKMLLGQ